MKRIHIIGRKNSGKTTLIVDLVAALNRRGHRVGTVKHTHHDHELDTPGKDSHRHREAGSAAVGILTRHMNAIFWPQHSGTRDAQSDQQKYGHFDALMQDCDIVLVEGDTQTTAPKIEIYRQIGDDGEESLPLASGNPAILAVVTDDRPDVVQDIWQRSDLDAIVNHLEAMLEPEA